MNQGSGFEMTPTLGQYLNSTSIVSSVYVNERLYFSLRLALSSSSKHNVWKPALHEHTHRVKPPKNPQICA